MKKVIKFVLFIVLIVILAAAALIGCLSVTEYRPAAQESLELMTDEAREELQAGDSISLLSWNIGYAGLGAESDFFMDGGKDTRSADKETTLRYLEGIDTVTSSAEYDLIALQEVDTSSMRTYSINEAAELAFGDSVHALNYSCPFVPYPLPPIGKVHSGLLTISDYNIESAERISLPCPFSWPVRIANLKRCLLVSRIPVKGSNAQLVLVNLHLEAYDSGEGKIAQTKMLTDFIRKEYENGNYVIAAGDFNQVFPGTLEVYPNQHPENWLPGVLDAADLPEGFSFAWDGNTPTCRLLNQPYNPSDTENTQHYVIDGFIVSPNLSVESVETLNLGFVNSDHNPVHLKVKLGDYKLSISDYTAKSSRKRGCKKLTVS